MPKLKGFKTFAQEERERELRKLYGNLMTLSTVQEELGRVVEKTARTWVANMPATKKENISMYRVADYADLERRYLSDFCANKPQRNPKVTARAAELRELYGGMMVLKDVQEELGKADPKYAKEWLSGLVYVKVNGKPRYRVLDFAEWEYLHEETP